MQPTAGFGHVRLPIRWSSHTGPAPNHTIDPDFFAEVDEAIDLALAEGLSVVIDNHFFEALDADPAANRAELVAIWRQIAERYAGEPDAVVFELNNEPTAAFDDDPDAWNSILTDVLAAVRVTNPTRRVVVGPVGYNHPNRLGDLRLPDDPNLIVTVHVYDPTTFTAQAAPWFDPPPPTGVRWSPDQWQIDDGWNPASWDSDVVAVGDGLEVTFAGQWAGFAAQSATGPLTGYDEVVVTADAEIDGFVLCNPNGSVSEHRFDQIRTTATGTVELRADVSSCPSIDTIAIQHAGVAAASVVLHGVDLCRGNGGCEAIVTTAGASHLRTMERTATWAADRGLTAYLGEFGVYDDPATPVDPASRRAWIASMRSAADAFGIDWAFFEFANDFGIYDPDTGIWDDPVLALLFPDATAIEAGYTDPAPLLAAARELAMSPGELQRTGVHVIRFINGISGIDDPVDLDARFVTDAAPSYVSFWPEADLPVLQWVMDGYRIDAEQAHAFGGTLLTFLAGLD